MVAANASLQAQKENSPKPCNKSPCQSARKTPANALDVSFSDADLALLTALEAQIATTSTKTVTFNAYADSNTALSPSKGRTPENIFTPSSGSFKRRKSPTHSPKNVARLAQQQTIQAPRLVNGAFEGVNKLHDGKNDEKDTLEDMLEFTQAYLAAGASQSMPLTSPHTVDVHLPEPPPSEKSCNANNCSLQNGSASEAEASVGDVLFHNRLSHEVKTTKAVDLIGMPAKVSASRLSAYRLRVLDVQDDVASRKKVLHCQKDKPGIQRRPENCREVEMSVKEDSNANVFVVLCDEWYGSCVDAGNIVQVVDMDKSVLDPVLREAGAEGYRPSIFMVDSNDRGTVHSPTASKGHADVGASSHNQILSMNGSRHGGREVIIRIDSDRGLLVVDPDELVSPTRVAESCGCTRRGVVAERCKGLEGGSSAPAVIGNLRHSFMEMLLEKAFSRMIAHDRRTSRDAPSSSSTHITRPSWHQLIQGQEIDAMVKASISTCLSDLYIIGMTDTEAVASLHELVGPVLTWALSLHYDGCTSTPHIADGHSSNSGPTRNIGASRHLSSEIMRYNLQRVQNAEEKIWCPFLGLKGMVDVVCKATLTSKLAALNDAKAGVEVLIPLELKTGKWKASTAPTHRAQVILYLAAMLMREYGEFWDLHQINHPAFSKKSNHGVASQDMIPSAEGLLLYINGIETKMEIVTPRWDEVVALIISRNALASQIAKSNHQGGNCRSADGSSVTSTAKSAHRSFPVMLNNVQECTYCFQAAECMTYHAALDGGNATSSGAPEVFAHLLRRVTPFHVSYIKYWEELLDLEESACESSLHSLWTLPSSEKELRAKGQGGCVGNLLATSCARASPTTEEYKIVFKKENESQLFNFEVEDQRDESNVFSVGERVIISVEKSVSDDSPSSSSSSSSSTTDIENIGMNGISTEPNIAIGHVTEVTDISISLTVPTKPTRVLTVIQTMSVKTRSGGFRRCHFRIDREVNTMSMSYLRASLLSLFVRSHKPKTFLDMEQARKNGMPTEEDEAANRKRLRELIVDLVPPTFPGKTALKEGLRMFTPDSLSDDFVEKALVMLDFYGSGMLDAQEDGKTPASSSQTQNPIRKTHEGLLYILDYFVVYPGCNPYDLLKEFNDLNEDQREAVRHALLAKDYALLQGYPGTGKTNVISFLIRTLVARGEKVLVSAYTHSAVDNVLCKLAAAGVAPSITIRVGTARQSPPAAQAFMLHVDKLQSIAELKARCEQARIVASTALSVQRNALARFLQFDTVVLDEAGQILEPATVGALLNSKKFVLVGDPLQLPPLVVSKEAKQKGMEVSLMKRLADKHPQALSCLTRQYRMSSEIMALSNRLFYKDAMSCGSARQVHDASLAMQMPTLGNAILMGKGVPELSALNECLAPSRQVVFVNTDSLLERVHMKSLTLDPSSSAVPASVLNVDTGTMRSEEGQVVANLVKLLDAGGMNVSASVGIIAPYRSYVHTLECRINQKHGTRSGQAMGRAQSLDSSSSASGAPNKPQRVTSDPTCASKASAASIGNANARTSADPRFGCEVSTVDKYQGRDMDVIIFATGYYRTDGGHSELLQDARRMNVAFTRARQKLIIVGSMKCLRNIPVWKDVCAVAHDKSWILNLPSDKDVETLGWI
jgi:hypothetical protein